MVPSVVSAIVKLTMVWVLAVIVLPVWVWVV